MPPPRVVEPVDVLEDRGLCLSLGWPVLSPDQFGLQRFKKRFDRCVVVAVIRRYVLTVLAPIGIFFAIGWKQSLPLTADEQALFTRLDEAIPNNPPRESDIISAFGPSACHGGVCPPKRDKLGHFGIWIAISACKMRD